MPPDISRTLEVHASPWRMLGILLATGGMCVLSAVMALGGFADAKISPVIVAIAGAGAVLFGVVTLLILRQWLASKGPVLTITPSGIRDTRIAPEEIPWSSVTNLAVWKQQYEQTLVLSVQPETEAALTLTRTARWSRGPNKALGVDGLCVPTNGLKIGFEELLAEVSMRWQAARAGGN